MADPAIDATREQTDPGALNAWLMLLGIQLLVQLIFQGSEGVRLVHAIAELRPSMVVFKWFVAVAIAVSCLLSFVAGILLFARRRPSTVKVIHYALWIGGPVMSVALLAATSVALNLPFAKVWDSSAPYAILRSFLFATLWSIYVYRSRTVRARYCLAS
ncbi:DUF2569 domain-containing protein [Bordetella sputigena]|uniref:hypothetical protein n=1 Tax=Bordetella sputigena TaxID=1416810 RepID=UPI0039EF24F9